jgi:lipid-A-disaccharide synthase
MTAPVRVFFSTGEPSGDMLAASLAVAMRGLAPDTSFAGIGNERMEAAGIALTQRTTGWASLGPIEALRRIPPLFASCIRHGVWIARAPWDLVVLVDFGAFNLRFAWLLRTLGYRRPILYLVPPGAWFDKPKQARAVARYATALTPFAHQRDFYRSLDLPVVSFGHPLVSLVPPRAPRPPAPEGGGTVAILPGSRSGEIARHMGPLLAACKVLRRSRPRVRFTIAAADSVTERMIAAELDRAFLPPYVPPARSAEKTNARSTPADRSGFTIANGSRAALDDADAAWIASGTAVLEAALREVPTVALYIVSAAQLPIARRIWKRPYITLPNILLDRPVVPECLQDDATPERLADEIDVLLRDPAQQLADVRALRRTLGGEDALERSAAFALGLARI